jgi:hypothetical protein
MGPSCAHSRRRSAAHAGHAPWRGDSRALGLGRRRSSERPMRSSLLMRGCESCSTVRTNRQRHPSCPCIVWQRGLWRADRLCASWGQSVGGRPCRAICRGICADLARGCDKTDRAKYTDRRGGCHVWAVGATYMYICIYIYIYIYIYNIYGAVPGGCGQSVQHATDTCRCNMQRAPAGATCNGRPPVQHSSCRGIHAPLSYAMKHTDRRAAVQSGADMHCNAVTCTICRFG